MGMTQRGPMARAKLGRAGRRAEHELARGRAKGSGKGGPAPIAQEGPSFSKALSLHGFLGG